MVTPQAESIVASHDLTDPVFLIGRQPILNRDQELCGYELLYRPTSANCAGVYDGDQATLSVLMNTFSLAGLNTIVGNHIAFINISRGFLEGRYPISLPIERTILEIQEDIEMDDELIDAMTKLNAAGYRLALDGVVSLERVDRVAEIVKYVKVNVSAVPQNDLPRLVRRLKELGFTLVAEKVETMEVYRLCHKMGFDYFQGYYFCRPEMIQVRRFESSRMVILRALAILQNPDVSLNDTNRIISMDATLGYRVLKLVNSAHYGIPLQITSLRHAISMIGINELNKWLRLLLMTRVENKPNELCITAMFRAKLAELFANQLESSKSDSFFLAGLFSILDALFDIPMAEILRGIELSSEITSALLRRDGDIGKMLLAIEAIERGDWTPVLAYNFAPETINSIYLQSVEWTEKIKKELDMNSEMGIL